MTIAPHRFPVSVKGVAIGDDGRVALRRNERDEWELPGGRLEPGETPEECVARRVGDEVGWSVSADRLLDVWLYEPIPDRQVLIVTYGCRVHAPDMPPANGDEREEIGLFDLAELPGLPMPDGYKGSINDWCRRRPGR
ncbi:NUDIX hydrolase [Streptomyces bobili]|uniref:NUDIX hydrolase n=1 Tax=Streptomyces bobili TaxID=67280 RepID=UPI00343C8BB8